MKDNNESSNPIDITQCSRCVLPETHETIFFDDEGVCNVCRGIEIKQKELDWIKKEKSFRDLIEKYRGKFDYDCILPFSGGKDSTFTLLTIVRDYGLKPLVVSFDHGFMRPTVLSNRERTFKILGVDHLNFRPNWKIVQKLMRESLLRKGDFCWHCHTGIFAYPIRIAVKFNVPLVIWGEPSAEYTAYYSYDQPEEVDEKRFNRFINLGINAEDMIGMIGNKVDARDLIPYTYPDLGELRKIGFRSICLGSFIPWDVKTQVKRIREELEWQQEAVEGVPPEYGYEKIECSMQGVRDYLKFTKRGYGRTSHLASIDIRNGRLDREEAIGLVSDHDGNRPESLDVFLKHVGITESNFNEIADSHAVSPYKHDWRNVKNGNKLWDQDKWDTSSPHVNEPLVPPEKDK